MACNGHDADPHRPGERGQDFTYRRPSCVYLGAEASQLMRESTTTETNPRVNRHLGPRTPRLCRRPQPLVRRALEPILPEPDTRRARPAHL